MRGGWFFTSLPGPENGPENDFLSAHPLSEEEGEGRVSSCSPSATDQPGCLQENVQVLNLSIQNQSISKGKSEFT